MGRALVYIVPVALAIYALIDLSRATPVERAGLHPAAWVAVVLLLPVIGPLVWILVSSNQAAQHQTAAASGRPATRGGAGSGRASRPARRGRPVAPDDDPEFLRRLEQQQRGSARRPGDAPDGGTPEPGTPDPGAPDGGTPDGAAGTDAAGDAGTDVGGDDGTDGGAPGDDDTGSTPPPPRG